MTITGGSGAWNSTTLNAPWTTGVVPTSLDDVTVGATHIVTVPNGVSAACNTLTLGNVAFNVNAGGSLVIGNDPVAGTTVLTLSRTGNTVYGKMDVSGSVFVRGDASLTGNTSDAIHEVFVVRTGGAFYIDPPAATNYVVKMAALSSNRIGVDSGGTFGCYTRGGTAQVNVAASADGVYLRCEGGIVTGLGSASLNAWTLSLRDRTVGTLSGLEGSSTDTKTPACILTNSRVIGCGRIEFQSIGAQAAFDFSGTTFEGGLNAHSVYSGANNTTASTAARRKAYFAYFSKRVNMQWGVAMDWQDCVFADQPETAWNGGGSKPALGFARCLFYTETSMDPAAVVPGVPMTDCTALGAGHWSDGHGYRMQANANNASLTVLDGLVHQHIGTTPSSDGNLVNTAGSTVAHTIRMRRFAILPDLTGAKSFGFATLLNGLDTNTTVDIQNCGNYTTGNDCAAGVYVHIVQARIAAYKDNLVVRGGNAAGYHISTDVGGNLTTYNTANAICDPATVTNNWGFNLTAGTYDATRHYRMHFSPDTGVGAAGAGDQDGDPGFVNFAGASFPAWVVSILGVGSAADTYNTAMPTAQDVAGTTFGTEMSRTRYAIAQMIAVNNGGDARFTHAAWRTYLRQCLTPTNATMATASSIGATPGPYAAQIASTGGLRTTLRSNVIQ